MKKYLLLVLFAVGLSSCGGSTEKTTDETATEEEVEIVEGINADIEDAQEELTTEVEENLTEIDSLLQNVE